MKKEYYLVFVLLILTFFINYFYPTSHQYPIHADEYAHISQAIDIVEKGKIDFVNPYFSYQPFHLRLENGFHLFLAFFIIFLKDNFILFFSILKNLIFVLNTFLIFLFSYQISRKFSIGVFSALFFITLKSSLDILGNLFLLPLNLGIALTLITLIFLSDYKEKNNKKYFYLSIIFFFLTLITYPPIGIFLFIILIVNQFFEMGSLKEKIKDPIFKLILTTVVFLLLIALYLIFSLNIPPKEFIEDFIIFNQEWTPIFSSISPFTYFGILASILSFIGLTFILIKKQAKLISVWFLFSLIDLYLFYLFRFTIFIPFRRLFFFFLISLCILASFGLFFLIKIIKEISSKNLAKIILALVVILIFSMQFYSFYQNAKDFKSSNVLTDAKYDLLKYIEENYGTRNVIMADPITSFAVFPVTKNYVVGLLESNINIGKRKEQSEFFSQSTNCTEKEKIIRELEVKLVIPLSEINCDFLEKKKSDKGVVFYEVKLTN